MLALKILLGVIAYCGLVVFIGKFMAVGLGSDRETACEAYDAARNAYRLACKAHHGQAGAWKRLRDAQSARLKAGA